MRSDSVAPRTITAAVAAAAVMSRALRPGFDGLTWGSVGGRRADRAGPVPRPARHLLAAVRVAGVAVDDARRRERRTTAVQQFLDG